MDVINMGFSAGEIQVGRASAVLPFDLWTCSEEEFNDWLKAANKKTRNNTLNK